MGEDLNSAVRMTLVYVFVCLLVWALRKLDNPKCEAGGWVGGNVNENDGGGGVQKGMLRKQVWSKWIS